MTTEPRDMTPVNRLLWLRDELEREDIVDLLREDFDDLSLPALRQMAAYTQAVAALTAAAPDERRMDDGARGESAGGCDTDDAQEGE